MRREVALKEFFELDHTTLTAADRCLREIWAAGAVSHPAVLPPHEFGIRPSGASYYTMPLVEGRTLTDVVARAHGFEARLRLLPHVVDVAQAIAAAHAKGFVHRDLKPSNVMVGDFGETRVLDWGLARLGTADVQRIERDTDEPAVTQMGTVMGTPAYMSPEQAHGHVDVIGPSSDVWSLGALLFHVLTGQAPFRGASAENVIEAVRSDDRVPLTIADGQIPNELVAIVGKAMALRPEQRYPDAASFADDLVAFQTGGRVSAHVYRWRDRVGRFARRYRPMLIGTAAVIVTLSAGLATSVALYRREVAARASMMQALETARLAEHAADESARWARREATSASMLLARANVESAERSRMTGHPLASAWLAARSLDHNPAHANSPRFDAEAATELNADVAARALGVLLLRSLDSIASAGPTRSDLTPSPATSIAASGPWIAIADAGDRVRVHDRRGALAVELPGHGEALDVVLSPSGKFAVTRNRESTVRLWTLPQGTRLGEWSASKVRVSVTVSDTGRVAYVGDGETLHVVRAPQDAPTLLPHKIERPFKLQLDADGTHLFVGTEHGELWSLSMLAEDHPSIQWKAETPAAVSDLAFSSDGTRLAVGFADGQVLVVDPRVAGRQRHWVGPRGSSLAVVWSTDGTTVYSAGLDGFVHGRPLDLGEPPFELASSVSMPLELEATAERLTLYEVKASREWELDRPRSALELPPETLSRSVFRSGEAVWLSNRAQPRLVRLDGGTGIALEGVAPVMQLTAENEFFWTLHVDGLVARWQVDGETWTQTHAWKRAQVPSTALAVCPETGWVGVFAGAGAITVWRQDDDAPRSFEGHDEPVVSLACSPDGTALVSADLGGKILRWAVEGDEPPTVLGELGGWARSVVFLPTGDLLAVGQFGLRRWVHGMGSGESLATVAHTQVSFGGARFAALRHDGGAAVYGWDGKPWIDFRNFGGREVLAVALSQDGDVLHLNGRRLAWTLQLDDAMLQQDTAELLRDVELDVGQSEHDLGS